MNEIKYCSLLRDLSNDYANQRISFEQYRAERKILLWKIDEEYNDVKSEFSEHLLEPH